MNYWRHAKQSCFDMILLLYSWLNGKHIYPYPPKHRPSQVEPFGMHTPPLNDSQQHSPLAQPPETQDVVLVIIVEPPVDVELVPVGPVAPVSPV